MFDRISISFYGGSHEKKIGAVVKGLPLGAEFSSETISKLLKRRATNDSTLSSARKEDDVVNFVNGIKDNGDKYKITSDTIEYYIENNDYIDIDYSNIEMIPRPSHADYAAFKKFGEMPKGGGKYSGRMTALLCVIGGISMDILKKEGISFSSSIKSLGDNNENDSFGGIISCTINGIKPGQFGDALFDGLEGKISYSVFAVPAVKGIEFGDGFELTSKNGSETNDELYFDGNEIKLLSNHMGGIDGGISNGNPITFNVAIKPVPSIKKSQKSVDLMNNNNVEIEIAGRHDRCIVPRALPCIESCAAIAILDEYLLK